MGTDKTTKEERQRRLTEKFVEIAESRPSRIIDGRHYWSFDDVLVCMYDARIMTLDEMGEELKSFSPRTEPSLGLQIGSPNSSPRTSE